jgi:hypothetical protein
VHNPAIIGKEGGAIQKKEKDEKEVFQRLIGA